MARVGRRLRTSVYGACGKQEIFSSFDTPLVNFYWKVIALIGCGAVKDYLPTGFWLEPCTLRTGLI